MSQRSRILGALIAVALVVLGGCTDRDDRTGPTPPSTPASPAGCASAVTTAPLPTWARVGFTPPDRATTYVQGANGDIVGVLFGQRLTSPPPGNGRHNKILWVARVSGAGSMRIAATLTGSDVSVVRHVPGGPGPSIINMPAPGCWHFELTWAEYSDELDIPYEKG